MPPKELEFECISITKVKGATTYSFRTEEGDTINYRNMADSPTPVVQPGEKYNLTFTLVEK